MEACYKAILVLSLRTQVELHHAPGENLTVKGLFKPSDKGWSQMNTFLMCIMLLNQPLRIPDLPKKSVLVSYYFKLVVTSVSSCEYCVFNASYV